MPRSLADQLRGWSDDQLTRLLELRPDVAVPVPQDSAQLAVRLGTRASAQRALDELDLLELTVLDAVLALDGTAAVPRLTEVVHADPERTERALARLRAAALVWGGPDEVRALGILSDLVGTTVSGLGSSARSLLASYGPERVGTLAGSLGLTPTGDRSADVEALADRLADPSAVAELLADVDPRARGILDHLEREGKDGAAESTHRQASRREPVGPVDQLLARGLLLARDHRHVAVPREVAICLRGGRTTRTRADDVPALATSPRDQTLVDRAAAGAAYDAVRRLETLLEQWGATPPPALRSGGLSVRDLKATAALLHVDEHAAALLVEVAAAAGLFGLGRSGRDEPALLPTDEFDHWTRLEVSQRWLRLAQAWLETPRLVGLVGSRQNGKPVNALGPDLDRPWLPRLRRTVLGELAGLPDGEVLAAGTGLPALVERLRWLRPRGPASRATAAGWVVDEAALLGVVGLGGLAEHGRRLVGNRDGVPAALDPLLPAPVDHVLVQADLTAVAPGPLERDLARRLASVADIESSGGATVYRFSESSVRRAFDAGWSAAEVHRLVSGVSRTPVPQPLQYLVDDVARRFGTLRLGAVESFLRSDDESALTELLHHPKAAALRLRRIAPTVVVCDVPVDVLLPRLHELGVAPVLESVDGSIRLARPETRRARTTPRSRERAGPARSEARLAAAVAAIRAGDRAAQHRPARPTGVADSSPAAMQAALRDAAQAGQTVSIGYVDGQGTAADRVVDPMHVHAGQLTAFDHRSQQVRLFAVHRITAVTELSGADG